MKIIDIINKIYNKEELPKKIEYLQRIFTFKYGGYYTEIGDGIFNYISEDMLDKEIKILKW